MTSDISDLILKYLEGKATLNQVREAIGLKKFNLPEADQLPSIKLSQSPEMSDISTKAGTKQTLCNHITEVISNLSQYEEDYSIIKATFCPLCGERLLEEPCTHYGIDSGGIDYYGTSNPPEETDWNYAYCPKCGEKL